jgi:hypothetical protein
VKRIALVVVVLVALASTALSVAASSSRQKISAKMTARVAVPKPLGAKKARGKFFAFYTVRKKDVLLKWNLSFSHLTSRATGATLSEGKPGLIGTRITILCKVCKSGKGATTLMKKSVAKALASGMTYVTLYTKRNPAGELRGQLLIKRRHK